MATGLGQLNVAALLGLTADDAFDLDIERRKRCAVDRVDDLAGQSWRDGY